MIRDNAAGFQSALIHFADWIQSTKQCDIVYAALCTTRSETPPRPLIGISYMAIGEYEAFHRGTDDIHYPNGRARISSCLEGGKTSEPRDPVGMWSVAIDIGSVPEYAYLEKQSLLEQAQVHNPKKLTQAFQRVANAFLNRTELSSAYYLKASLLNLCAVLLDDLQMTGKNSPDSINAFDLACAYMLEHYADEELNQQAIADAAFVSIRHLTRLFRQFASSTPMQYLKKIRMQQARVLLETSLLSMTEITQEIGLKDSLHFSRLFRQAYGLSPSDYRQSNGRLMPSD